MEPEATPACEPIEVTLETIRTATPVRLRLTAVLYITPEPHPSIEMGLGLPCHKAEAEVTSHHHGGFSRTRLKVTSLSPEGTSSTVLPTSDTDVAVKGPGRVVMIAETDGALAQAELDYSIKLPVSARGGSPVDPFVAVGTLHKQSGEVWRPMSRR